MTTEQKCETLELAIEEFKNYIENADHWEPTTQQLIIDSISEEMNEEQTDYVTRLVYNLQSFIVFDKDLEDESDDLDFDEVVLDENHLADMLEDLEYIEKILAV